MGGLNKHQFARLNSQDKGTQKIGDAVSAIVAARKPFVHAPLTIPKSCSDGKLTPWTSRFWFNPLLSLPKSLLSNNDAQTTFFATARRKLPGTIMFWVPTRRMRIQSSSLAKIYLVSFLLQYCVPRIKVKQLSSHWKGKIHSVRKNCASFPRCPLWLREARDQDQMLVVLSRSFIRCTLGSSLASALSA